MIEPALPAPRARPGWLARLRFACACFARALAGLPLGPADAASGPPTRAASAASGAGAVGAAGAAQAAGAGAARAGAGADAGAAAPPPAGSPTPFDGAVALLALLQRSGRLVDFLAEPIDGFTDAQIGLAARAVHAGCARALRERARLVPLFEGRDGEATTVPAGFDPEGVRLSGAPAGDPPFRGRLLHPGWRLASLDLALGRPGAGIVAPGEVEVG